MNYRNNSKINAGKSVDYNNFWQICRKDGHGYDHKEKLRKYIFNSRGPRLKLKEFLAVSEDSTLQDDSEALYDGE